MDIRNGLMDGIVHDRRLAIGCFDEKGHAPFLGDQSIALFDIGMISHDNHAIAMGLTGPDDGIPEKTLRIFSRLFWPEEPTVFRGATSECDGF